MVIPLLAALAVAWMPGALIYRLPYWNRPARASLAAEERLFWAVLLSLLVSLTLVIALAAANRYTFGRVVGADLALSAFIVAGWRERLLLGPGAPRPGLSALVAVALVLVGLALYFPPSEYVIGGKDPGTYLNEGIQIAQRGQLVVRDEDVASVPAQFRDLFFPWHQQPTYYGLRFMGFFIQDPADGTVVGQFPHLLPASMAIGYALDGLSGAREAVAVWAILGLLAVYFAGARFFGRVPAAAAAGLLAINVVEVWFARYPNSEVVMQTLLFAAMLAFVRAADGSRVFFGGLSGALLGLTLLLRFEIILAMGAFALVIASAPVIRQRVGLTFVIALGFTSWIGLTYLRGPMRAYWAYPQSFFDNSGGWATFAAGAIALIGTNVVLRWAPVQRLVRASAPGLLATALGLLAVYAYFYRQPIPPLAPADAAAFRSFGWYLTPPVLAAAVAGTVVLTWRAFWRVPIFFAVLSTFGIFFFYKTRIVPEHFWAARRFLGVALPGALLTLTCGLDLILRDLFRRRRSIADSRDEPRTGRAEEHNGLTHQTAAPVSPGTRRSLADTVRHVIVIVAAGLVGIVFWRQSAPVRHHVEYAGLIPRLESLAGRIGDRDLLIVEARNAGSDLHTLALPLAYIYARHVLVLDSAIPSKRQLEDFVTWARERYASVYFLGGGGTDLLTRRVTAEPIASERFSVPEYESAFDAYPTGVRRKDFEYGLYRLLPTTTAVTGPIDLRIGSIDDLNVVRFYAKETRPDTGTDFRWTRNVSYVLLVGVAPTASTVTVWLSNGGRPAQAPPATVEVSFGDTVLGTATPTDAIEPYTFALPTANVLQAAEVADPVRLRFRVPTWNPGTLLGAPDTRDLGVLLTRVQVN